MHIAHGFPSLFKSVLVPLICHSQNDYYYDSGVTSLSRHLWTYAFNQINVLEHGISTGKWEKHNLHWSEKKCSFVFIFISCSIPSFNVSGWMLFVSNSILFIIKGKYIRSKRNIRWIYFTFVSIFCFLFLWKKKQKGGKVFFIYNNRKKNYHVLLESQSGKQYKSNSVGRSRNRKRYDYGVKKRIGSRKGDSLSYVPIYTI